MKEVKKKIIFFLKKPIIYILMFCICIQIITYKTIPNYIMTDDSYTYIENYNDKSIFKGEVDSVRTPVYPYLTKIIKRIGGEEKLSENIVLFQKVLFIFTLILFYACLKKVTRNSIVIYVLTIIFGICPFITFWNIMVLTEALSLFEVVLLCFITLQYLNKPNKKCAIMMRSDCISNDFNQTIFYLSISNIYIILDFEKFL